MKAVYIFFAFAAVLIITSVGCKKKKMSQNLYDEATASDLLLYQNKDSILSAAGTSPHGAFKLKFNQKAVDQFGADGKFPAGGEFEKGSLIVKEVYKNGSLTQYAVMKKDDSKFSGSGWLWAEYDTQGDVVFSIDKKGEGCIGCHSGNPNRDLTISFDLH
jgi:hypothetical protein